MYNYVANLPNVPPMYSIPNVPPMYSFPNVPPMDSFPNVVERGLLAAPSLDSLALQPAMVSRPAWGKRLPLLEKAQAAPPGVAPGWLALGDQLPVEARTHLFKNCVVGHPVTT